MTHGFFLFMHIQCIDRSYFKGMILPYCVYVLQSQRDLLLYHGFTTNLEQRIRNHNAGKTISTSKRMPLRLIFCEYYLSRKDAMRREKYFKTTQGKRMLRLMLRNTLKEIRYPINQPKWHSSVHGFFRGKSQRGSAEGKQAHFIAVK